MREAENREKFIAALVAREMEERGKQGGERGGEGGGEDKEERGWEVGEAEVEAVASEIEGLSIRSKRERERSQHWAVGRMGTSMGRSF